MNMKTKTRTVALILACLTAVAVFASCGKGGKNDTNDTGKGAANVTEPAARDEIDEYVESLAKEYDVSGKTFTYVGHSVNFPKEEKESGDILSNGLYYRQRDLVQVFGINWDPVSLPGGDDTKDAVINEVTAGGNEYDLVCGGMLTCGQAMLNAGVLQSVENLEFIDLDREWWVQSMRDTFSVRGRLYYLFGPIVPYTYLDSHCVLFNKNLTSMFGISDDELYSLASEGKWTIDELQKAAAKIPAVTNSQSGTYRFVHPVGVPFLFAAGMKITKFEEDGTPYVETALPLELSDLSDRLVAFQGDATQTAYLKKDEEASKKFGVEEIQDLFNIDRALFYFADTGDIMYLRTQSVRFGILPMPKATAAQSQYYTFSTPWVGQAVYLPKSVKDRGLSALMAEAMAALSQKHVKTAYYDKMLRSQAIFDMESQEMLDIIFSTKVYDMAVLYSDGNTSSWGPFFDALDKALSIDNSTFASEYKANAKVANINIKFLINTVESDG